MGSRLLSHARFTWGILAVSAAAAVLNGVLSLLVLGTPGELVWIAAIATPVLVGVVVVRRRPEHRLAGFFVLVLAQSGRCTRAPLVRSDSNRASPNTSR